MDQLHDKITLYGASALTDVELLTLLLDGKETAERVLEAAGTLTALAINDVSRLRMMGGMGLRNAGRLAAAAELGRRVAVGSNAATVITSSADVVKELAPLLCKLKHEECWVLYLTSANRIIERQRISQGGLVATVVDHRLVVKRALELFATRIVVAHNHPSGSAVPSDADVQLTRRIREAAALFDIELLDHVIIASSGDSASLKSSGLL